MQQRAGRRSETLVLR